MMHEILKEVYANIYSYLPVGQQENFDLESMKGKKIQNPQQNQDTINIEKLDMTKDTNKTRSLLELLVLIVGKHLSLTAEQSASLFTNQGKYLAYLVAKGVKNIFDPIINIFQELYQASNHIVRLIQEDSNKKNFFFFMNALKSGLVSKHSQVAQWAFRLFAKISFEVSQTNMYKEGWDWMCGESNGLNQILLGLKRHNDTVQYVVAILLQFGRNNMQEVFTRQLQRSLTEVNDFLNVLQIMLPQLIGNESVKQELLQNGVIEEWLNISIECTQLEYVERKDTKIKGLILMTDLWIQFQALVENLSFQNTIMTSLDACTKDSSYNIFLTAVQQLFRLLEEFTMNRNYAAKLIYKNLSLCLFENHQKLVVREIILKNFMYAFTNNPLIPIEILVDPLIRQIQVAEEETYRLNIIDFEFLLFISKHEKIKESIAIRMMDLLAKIYLNNLVFAQVSGIIIMNLIQKFYERSDMNDFVIKFIKIALSMYFASEKLRKSKEANYPANNKSSQVKNIMQAETDQEIIQAQKRTLIVQIIHQIVQVNDDTLNKNIQKIVAHTNIQIQNFQKNKKPNRGMISILEYFGDPQKIINECEMEFKEHQQQQKMNDKETSLLSMNAYIDSTVNTTNLDGNNESIRAIQENMRKNGQTATKEELQHLSQLRNPQVLTDIDKKNMDNLAKIQKNFQEREKQLLETKAEKQQRESMLKKNIKQTIDKRNIEHGIAPLLQNDYQEMRGVMIFDFNSRQRTNALENKNQTFQFNFIDILIEEDSDIIHIKNQFSKYSSFFHTAFNKYVGSSYNTTHKQKIVQNIPKYTEMNVPESYSFFKDFISDKSYTMENHKVVIKQVCLWEQRQNYNKPQKISDKSIEEKFLTEEPKQKVDLPYSHSTTLKKTTQQKDVKNFGWEGYKCFIIQIAGISFQAKQPSISLAQAFDQLVNECKNKCFLQANKQWNLEYVWKNQDGLMIGQSESIQLYNQQLEIDPDFELPQGFERKGIKKLQEKESVIEDEKQQNYFDCLEVLQEIFVLADQRLVQKNKSYLDRMNVRLIEKSKEVVQGYICQFKLKKQLTPPKSKYFEQMNAEDGKKEEYYQQLYNKRHNDNNKGKLTQEELDELKKKTDKDDHFKNIGKNKYGDKRKWEQNFHKPKKGYENMCGSLKVGLSQFSFKDRYMAEEVAFVIEDMVLAIENEDLPFLQYEKDKQRNPNQFLKIQQQKKEIEVQERQDKYEKIQKRQEYLKGDAMKEIKQKKQEEKELREVEEQEKKAEIEAQQKLKQEKEMADMRAKQKLVENYQSQRDEQLKIQQEEFQQEQKKRNEELKVKRTEFNQSQMAKIDQNFEQIKNKKEQYKLLSEEQQLRNLKIQKTNEVKVFKVGRERRKDEKATNLLIQALHYSPDIQQVYQENEYRLKTLFSMLKDQVYYKLGDQQNNRCAIYNPNTSGAATDFKANLHGGSDEINIKAFSWFAFHFKLFPEIIQPQEVMLIYRSLTNPKKWLLNEINNKDMIQNSSLIEQNKMTNQEIDQATLAQSQFMMSKNKTKAGYNVQSMKIQENKSASMIWRDIQDGESEKISLGINYFDFLEALTRIAIKGQVVFNKFVEHLEQEDDDLNQTNLEKVLDQQLYERLTKKAEYQNYIDYD